MLQTSVQLCLHNPCPQRWGPDSTIWSPFASDTNINKLQITQNTALRIATGWTTDTNTQHLHDETHTTTEGTPPTTCNIENTKITTPHTPTILYHYTTNNTQTQEAYNIQQHRLQNRH